MESDIIITEKLIATVPGTKRKIHFIAESRLCIPSVAGAVSKISGPRSGTSRTESGPPAISSKIKKSLSTVGSSVIVGRIEGRLEGMRNFRNQNHLILLDFHLVFQ